MFMDFMCTVCLVAFLSFLLVHKLVHVLYTHVFPCTGSEQAALAKQPGLMAAKWHFVFSFYYDLKVKAGTSLYVVYRILRHSH